VVFGATSCLRGNLPWPCLSRAAEEALDFFVLLGDSVYASASTLAGYRADWADVLEVEGMVALTTSTSIVATWDDHEVANNWSMEVVGKDRYMAALQAFREALPQTEGPGGGIWRSLRWGSTVEVFVLDCRTEREGDAYISVEQMNWLKQGLLDSPSRFKIICNSVPITDLTAIFGQAQEDDRWQGYPGQREEILSHIESLDIEGVLWITGDVHYGQIARVSASGETGDEAYEIFCGPGGSTVNIGALYYVGEDEQYEQLVLDFNYARFECDPVAGTIRVQHIDNEGYTLTDRVLNL
jgi:alkaline phosphatase D